MDERSSQILKAAIREFIENGEPISSEYLFRNYDFDIKPAMIRHELNCLSDEGYLEQPHYAAGRIPTDKGYEFYGEELLAEENGNDRFAKPYIPFFSRSDWDALLSELSRDLGVLGVISNPREKEVHKGFLENLIEGLEWNTHSEIREIIKDFDDLDERMPEVGNILKEDDTVKIFVGRKSPITRSGYLTVFAADYDVGRDKVFLCVIGPKRMDYEKPAKILKGLKKISKNKNGGRAKRK